MDELFVKKLETKRIIIFLSLTFVITYFVEFIMIAPLIVSTDQNNLAAAQMLVGSVMFIPAACALITRVITKEGFHNMWLKVEAAGNFRYFLFAWFGMILLTIIGAAIFFLFNPGSFDPDMGYMMDSLKAAGKDITLAQLKASMTGQIITAILLAPMMNALNCLGEEFAWRGYLLPKMKGKLPIIFVLLINGVIWGLWHVPLTMMGHNYGTAYKGYPYIGIIAMCIFCIVMGTIFSYITLKTKSCIPSMIAHGSLNGFAAVAIYFTKDGGNPFIGPSPTGIIGGIGFIAAAIFLAVIMVKEEKKSRL